MDNEFDIIKKYFTFSSNRDDVFIAAGDDCASVTVPDNKQLVITVDTLISGTHFPDNTSPEDVAYKSIMVNLSDLAAMGASPAWLTLAITLPEIDEHWLSRFSKSFNGLLERFKVDLVGGDTTKGALSITVQAMGLCDKTNILRRDRAEPGDKIYVTGYLGDAAIGLRAILDQLADDNLQPCITRLNRPEARVSFAEELVSYSRCAIDISDGLLADLGHILEASSYGAKISLASIPVSSASRYYFDKYNEGEINWSMLLAQGDDYELCFTASIENDSVIRELAARYGLPVSCIGEITESKSLEFFDANAETESIVATGFKHF
ncbi:MAG: thiamine-phosphate kinase [Gammaproteobacteria bacterium]|nr:thiamine-phosphate kinase [Gammaproteobacteria bacterium]MBT8133269.1 thiamine-phosphate kinase [Gammaproteobacteria bacterium]NNJ50241.1 thiamine-phosphate kinase [Gammaproteobacteria bacterium]